MTEVQFAKQFLTTLDSKSTKYQSNHVFDPQTFQLRIPYTLPKLPHPPHPLPPKSTPSAAPVPGSESILQAEASAAQPATIDITLKSTRNPSFTLQLPSLPRTTPIVTLKSHIQSLLSGTVTTEKIKVLYNKKPIPTSKSTIHDVLSDSSLSAAETPLSIEFGVMVMGGAPDPQPNTQTITPNNEVKGTGLESRGQTATETEPKDQSVDAMVGVEKSPSPSSATTTAGTRTIDQKVRNEPVQPGESTGKEVLATTGFWDDLQGFLEQRLKDKTEAVRLRNMFEKVAR